jgi:L-rhamnose-H+ transport protein
MQVLLGVIFHFIGGFASGSFYMPYKKVKGWHWESFWIVGGIFSWFIVPPLAAYLTIPGFTDIIKGTSGTALGITYLFGVLWGIGGLTYGLGVRYLVYVWFSGRSFLPFIMMCFLKKVKILSACCWVLPGVLL